MALAWEGSEREHVGLNKKEVGGKRGKGNGEENRKHDFGFSEINIKNL